MDSRFKLWLFIAASFVVALLVVCSCVVLLWRRLARARAEKSLIEARYNTFVEQADDGVFLVDAHTGLVVESNRALQERLGYSAAELSDLKLEEILVEVTPQHEAGELERSKHTRSRLRSLKHRCKNGRLLDVEVTASSLEINGRKTLCYVTHDVSERKKFERRLVRDQQRLEHLAHHDSLTGLPNRRYLRTYLDQSIKALELDASIAVMFLDLDDFKDINDVRGHDVGDQLLVAVANRLVEYIGDVGVVARLGGDEFVIVLRGVSDPDSVADYARSIQRFLTSALETKSSVSIGISFCPQDATDSVSLLRHADLAMYKAKGTGRGNVQLFKTEMSNDARHRLAMERAIGRAITAGEFIIQYQPLVDIATRRIVSLEALVRWQHPRLGLIPPDKFIPIAERTGLIVPLGEQILRTVCMQLVRWQQAGIPVVRVAVNWSSVQLKNQCVVDLTKRVIQETGVDPELLGFEITEGALMLDVHEISAKLSELRALGIRIQIDDFGTGYSSLSYLRHLPIDTLKIDRSFIKQVDTNAADQAIVSAIFAMAKSLGLRVVAEGVETSAQLEILRNFNCELAQGIYFSYPLYEAQCSVLLKELAVRPSFSDTLRLRLLNNRLINKVVVKGSA
jgi:diguanylate cyclase (GGDEF)-like protein/PAS domain S-box-containing protein